MTCPIDDECDHDGDGLIPIYPSIYDVLTGPATAWPPGIVKMLKGDNIQADESEESARNEIEAVVYGAVQVCKPSDPFVRPLVIALYRFPMVMA